MMLNPAISQTIQSLAEQFHFRPLKLPQDSALLQHWVRNPKAFFWGMQEQSDAQITAFYQQQINQLHTWPWIGLWQGEPIFLLESYHPAFDELAQHYEVKSGDIGMHFLVAPHSGKIVHGFSLAVLQAIVVFLFENPTTKRIIVEPDIRNEKVHQLNRAVGFEYIKQISLSHKNAWLAIYQRAHFINPKTQR